MAWFRHCRRVLKWQLFRLFPCIYVNVTKYLCVNMQYDWWVRSKSVECACRPMIFHICQITPESAYNLEKITHINPEFHATTRGAVTFRYMLRLALYRNLIWSLCLWEKPHFMVSLYLMCTEERCRQMYLVGTKVPCTLGWPYTEGTWLYCDYFIWCVSYTVVVLTCFVMCGCFGNTCTCIYCVLYCFVYVYYYPFKA